MEIFFNAVRSQNGWSYNPTAYQVRSALKKLITYAGNGILASASANCIAKDTTSILKIDVPPLLAMVGEGGRLRELKAMNYI